jgi:hypothetical protein
VASIGGYAIPRFVWFLIWIVVVILVIILLAFVVHYFGGGTLILRLGHFHMQIGVS